MELILMVGLKTLFWQLHAPIPSTVQHHQQRGGKEGERARAWNHPACFCQNTSVPGHVFAAHMSQVSTSCQYGNQRSTFDRSYIYILAPVQQENLFPLSELLLSLRVPQLQKCIHCWRIPQFRALERGYISACLMYSQDRAATFIQGRGRGRTNRQEHGLSPQKMHLSFHILAICVHSKPRVIKMWASELTSF